MSEWLEKFEVAVVWVIAAMSSAIVVLATIDLGRMLLDEVLRTPKGLVPIGDVLELFGKILLVLIGVELIETLRAYLVEHVIRVEVVFMVALIAMARKVIITDITKNDASSIAALAFLIGTLSFGYYILRRSHSDEFGGPPRHP